MSLLFLAGDVMTGRGMDQVLPRPGDPRLREDWVRDAREYVALAERRNGPIPRLADPGYPWGIALGHLDEVRPDARIVNLETSVTRSDAFWPGKDIHYRMHPGNVGALTAAGIDCCVLANNHVLDFGRPGLVETLATLEAAGIRVAGAGRDDLEAAAPAILGRTDGGRVLVFATGCASSGIPADWAAGAGRPGVCLLPDLTAATAERLMNGIARHRGARDLVVVSIHWGGNWGYEVPDAQQAFARALIGSGLVDCVHGHSSHHPKGVEVHRGKPILYGCGDFLNDYEGISGHARYRSDLSLMYLASLDPSGDGLMALEIVPVRHRRFTLVRPDDDDVRWLAATLDRESREFGVRVEATADGTRMRLVW